MTNRRDLLDGATRALRASGSSSPRLDAELLLGHVLGASRTELLTHPERLVGSEHAQDFGGMVQRRAMAEPMAYLLGEREFYGRMFQVDRRALIPRPETELLVDLGVAAIDRFRASGREPRVVEIGTGSGAIAISVALERNLNVIATDVSAEALVLARANARRLGVDDRVKFLATDLLRGLSTPIDVLLANLPYVPNDRPLPADVRDYEPHVALFGGPNGIELLARFLGEAHDIVTSDGELCVELDEEAQAAPISALARTVYPTASVSVCRDAGGYDRVVRVLMQSLLSTQPAFLGLMRLRLSWDRQSGAAGYPSRAHRPLAFSVGPVRLRRPEPK